MAQNTKKRFGPVALTTTLTTNVLNPGTGAKATPPVGYTDSNDYIILNHVRIVNKTGSAATVSFWLGATGANAAGTEVLWQAKSVPANDVVDFYGILRIDAADFLVGGAGTATALSFEAEGEIGKV